MPWNDTNQACCGEASQMLYDGNPLFFPIDDAKNALTDMRYRAKIPAEYGYNGWPWEDEIFPGAPMHDFHFTTEVVYWFKYDDKAPAVLRPLVRHGRVVSLIGGLLVVAIGFAMLFDWLSLLPQYFQFNTAI